MNRKVLFVHDGPILCNQEQDEFYAVHYNNTIVERYSFFGKEVSFLMRKKMILDSEKNKFSRINHESFRFIDVPNFKSIKSYSNKSKAEVIIKNAVNSHDVIILRLPSAIGSIAFEYAKEMGKPVLIEMVACVYDALWNYDWRGKVIAKSKMIKYQNILLKASHVIYVTDRFLQQRYPSKNKQIGCSDVVLSEFDESLINKRIEKIKNSKGILILGTVAAIDVPYKGQDDVIKVLAKLKDSGIDFKYKIVGQGDPIRLNKIIKKLKIEDNVEIIGSLTHDKVFEFLDHIDVYIQPSKQEGLPRAVVEAMSRGCPVIGSDLAGIPELIGQEALFQPGNRKELIALLKKLDKRKMEQWAKENFHKANFFHKDILDNKRIEFYKEFIEDYKI